MMRKKLWGKVVEESGQRIRIYELRLGGPLWISVSTGRLTSDSGKAYTAKNRRSLGHKNKAQAEREARALATELAEAKLVGRTNGSLTLGQLFTQYRLHVFETLSSQRRKEADARMTMFAECFGRDFDVLDLSQTHVNRYSARRRALDLVPPGHRLRPDGTRPIGYRTPRPPRDGALHGEFSGLSTICNWATHHRLNGKRLLAENPLHGLTWPREKNPRQPVASMNRYTATQARTSTIDPAGRLGCILALARFTGRRETAICALRADDVLLSADRLRVVLAAEGMDERLVEHYPHGAIRWSADADKEGFLFITPIGPEARDAVQHYLRAAKRLGDVPLFPSPADPARPISRDRASKWLRRAEAQAAVPKFTGGLWHPYRRLWASERKHLPDRVVAEAGGWRDTRALRRSYQHADAAEITAAVILR